MTYAVVAIEVSLSVVSGVGAVGSPVNIGEARLALRARAVVSAVEIGLLRSEVLSTLARPTLDFAREVIHTGSAYVPLVYTPLVTVAAFHVMEIPAVHAEILAGLREVRDAPFQAKNHAVTVHVTLAFHESQRFAHLFAVAPRSLEDDVASGKILPDTVRFCTVLLTRVSAMIFHCTVRSHVTV